MAADTFKLDEISGTFDNQGNLDGSPANGSDGPITANGTYILGISEDIVNNGSYNSVEFNVQLSNPVSADPNEEPWFEIRVVIEEQIGTNGTWVEVGTMFEPYIFQFQGSQQTVVLQPNILNIDEGVPVSVWDGEKNVAQIHRQQRYVGPTTRVKIYGKETQYNGSREFQSIDIIVTGVKYNAYN